MGRSWRFINAFALSLVFLLSGETPFLLYGPTLTSVHGHWKNHNFDSVEVCQQSDVSAF